MKAVEAVAWAACVCTCLLVAQVTAQYGPPPTKGKKHRTTTTTTENPALSNEISGPFPLPDNQPFPESSGSFPGPPIISPQPTGTGSYAFSSASSTPGNNAVGGGSYWWSGPDSPFKPGAQPSEAPVGCGAPGSPGGCGQFPSSPPIPQPPSPPAPASVPSGGCGGPAGCTGLGTDPRPPPSESQPKPVDIAQNPFLSSALLGKPIQGSPQGGYPAQPPLHSQYPGQPSTSPFPGPGAPSSSGQYPNQPQPSGSNPGHPQPTGAYPGQPQPQPGEQYLSQQPQLSGQYPGQQPQATGQYPGQQPQLNGQYPTQQPQPTGQYPGQQPQPIGQYPGQQSQPTGQFPGQSQYPGQKPQTTGQYPSQQPQPTGQYPGQQPKPSGQYPGQQIKPSGQYPGQQPQYPSQPQPTGQYPGQQPQPTGQYPGQRPQPTGQYPGQQLQPTGQYPEQQPQYPSQPQPTGQYPGQQPQPTGQYPGQQPQLTGQYPGQQRPPNPYSGQPSSQGVPLRPQCAATDHACVPASMCAGGVITSNGLRQMRDPQIKECIPGLESCCKIPTTPGPGFATSRPDYRPATQQPYTGPLNTTPYPGCPAALKCVAEIYCTAEGVMSDTPVVLTREQQNNKVPTTDCQDLESGLIGKCCRDPNYKDPWPAGMMMMKNQGDFDDGQYHGEGSGPGSNFVPPFNTISPTSQSPSKDHGPKPSQQPGGYNKPFPPPFPGNSANQFPNTPERQQPPQSNSFDPKPTAPSGKPTIPSSYQPNQPISPNIPEQPQQGLPTPTGQFQPDQPSGTPYQSGQPTPYQPGQPTPYQPGQPTPSAPTYQPSQPPTGSYQPGPAQPVQPSIDSPIKPPSIPDQSVQPSTEPDQPPDTYQPGQPVPPRPQNNYGLPTHPGQNKPAEPDNPTSGPTPGTSCGVRRPGPDGDVAGFGEFPWQALVVAAGNRTLLCGAAIIADNAVITAAHCVNQLRSQDLLVKAGEWKLLGQNPKQPQVRPVAAISRHPGFDSGSLTKDLAILVILQPFTLDTHVDKICVPPQLGPEYFQRPGQNCVVTGWGKQALQGPVQNSDLHKVDVNIVPAEQCEAKLKSSHLGKYFKLNEGFSCALPSTPADICKVDFGSGVACDRGDGFYELAGINSWDLACQTKQALPTVFATSDSDWINAILAAPLPQLQQQEEEYIQGLLKGENVDGIDVDDKPGFSQGYGK